MTKNIDSTKNRILTEVKNFLDVYSIRADFSGDGTVLLVSRDDMINSKKGSWESQYEDWLNDIKLSFPGWHFFWGGKDDQNLWLEMV
jgi:hypothetical protein